MRKVWKLLLFSKKIVNRHCHNIKHKFVCAPLHFECVNSYVNSFCYFCSFWYLNDLFYGLLLCINMYMDQECIIVYDIFCEPNLEILKLPCSKKSEEKSH